MDVKSYKQLLEAAEAVNADLSLKCKSQISVIETLRHELEVLKKRTDAGFDFAGLGRLRVDMRALEEELRSEKIHSAKVSREMRIARDTAEAAMNLVTTERDSLAGRVLELENALSFGFAEQEASSSVLQQEESDILRRTVAELRERLAERQSEVVEVHSEAEMEEIGCPEGTLSGNKDSQAAKLESELVSCGEAEAKARAEAAAAAKDHDRLVNELRSQSVQLEAALLAAKQDAKAARADAEAANKQRMVALSDVQKQAVRENEVADTILCQETGAPFFGQLAEAEAEAASNSLGTGHASDPKQKARDTERVELMEKLRFQANEQTQIAVREAARASRLEVALARARDEILSRDERIATARDRHDLVLGDLRARIANGVGQIDSLIAQRDHAAAAAAEVTSELRKNQKRLLEVEETARKLREETVLRQSACEQAQRRASDLESQALRAAEEDNEARKRLRRRIRSLEDSRAREQANATDEHRAVEQLHEAIRELELAGGEERRAFEIRVAELQTPRAELDATIEALRNRVRELEDGLGSTGEACRESAATLHAKLDETQRALSNSRQMLAASQKRLTDRDTDIAMLRRKIRVEELRQTRKEPSSPMPGAVLATEAEICSMSAEKLREYLRTAISEADRLRERLIEARTDGSCKEAASERKTKILSDKLNIEVRAREALQGQLDARLEESDTMPGESLRIRHLEAARDLERREAAKRESRLRERLSSYGKTIEALRKRCGMGGPTAVMHRRATDKDGPDSDPSSPPGSAAGFAMPTSLPYVGKRG